MYRTLVVAGFGLLLSGAAVANTVTGTIRSLYVDVESGRAFVQMDGLAQFDGGGCRVYWSANNLTDQGFVKFIWPLLMTAKASGSSVSIQVNGCNAGYPKIVAAEFDQRLAN